MIEFNNLSVGYRKRRPVLKGLSGGFAEGAVHGLLGANGVGKTTLLKAVCGMLVPFGGSVSIDGQRSQKRLPSMLSEIFFIPEEFIIPPVSVARYAALTSPLYPNFSQEAFTANCREMGIDLFSNYGAMSMGQRKKAYIAFALATGVRYLLMDEPTNGLDIPGKSTLKRLLAAAAAGGMTIVISSHQVADFEKLVDSVTIMDNDGIILSATVGHIARALSFGEVPPGHDRDCLYGEETLAGYVGVTEKHSGDDGAETSVDLALLFNAAVGNRTRLTEIMNRKK